VEGLLEWSDSGDDEKAFVLRVFVYWRECDAGPHVHCNLREWG